VASFALLLGSSSTLVKVKENVTTSVAYPFTLIKPSWEEGDVTLQDINQRIRAPPKKAPEILGTSAFSGKPVIGKTRIRTEGGKGSITILRTKGWEPENTFDPYLSASLSIYQMRKGRRQLLGGQLCKSEHLKLPLIHSSRLSLRMPLILIYLPFSRLLLALWSMCRPL
jgi:hypothetical protein